MVINMTWGTTHTKMITEAEVPSKKYDTDYYRNLFQNRRAQSVPLRVSAVGKENTAKTGLLVDMFKNALTDLHGKDAKKKQITIIDVDNSAKATIDHIYPDLNIQVLPLHDEFDESIFNDDNTINYVALVDKMNYYINLYAEEVNKNPDAHGAIIIDGCSTFLKWCEHAMTGVLLRRGVIKEEGDSFNQKEWRTRNQLFRDVISRVHGLPIPCAGFTFHLKDVSNYVDNGNGGKVLMKIGERPEWEKGTMRYFSQQIFLTRFSKKGDDGAGVKKDNKLADDQWVVRATIEEMKGKNMEHVGTTHEILSVSDSKVTWGGLPMLKWGSKVEKGGKDVKK